MSFRRLPALLLAVCLLASCRSAESDTPSRADEPTPSGASSSLEPPAEPEAPAKAERVPPRGPSSYRPQLPDVAGRLRSAREHNGETAGWLTIPDTTVDEPVMQTYDNAFYLFHDELKQPRSSGALFLDYECSLGDGNGSSFSLNTIIYGHNLGNPPMSRDDPDSVRFAQLFKFTDFDFAQSHPYLFFSTHAGTQIYEIFAVSYTDLYPEPVSYILVDYPPPAFSLLLDDMRDRSLYDYPVDVDPGEDRILTLSTCAHRYGDEYVNPYQRLVIMARLVPEGWPFYETAGITPNPDPKEPDFTKYDTSAPLEDRISSVELLGLTAPQKLEDLDYLYQTLRENSPLAAAVDRIRGEKYDREAEYIDLRAWIGSGASDAQFIDIIRYLSGMYLAWLEYNPWIFPERALTYQEQARQESGDPVLQRLNEMYNDSATVNSYDKMSVPFGFAQSYQTAYYDASEKQQETVAERYVYSGRARPAPVILPSVRDDGTSIEATGTRNVRAAILEEGRTAYLRVIRFDESYLESDRDFLFKFYREIQDYENVIFDFTETQGDCTRYFDDLIASPNLDIPIVSTHYEFMKKGSNNESFLDFTSQEWRSPGTIPVMPKLSAEDTAGLEAVRQAVIQVDPLGGGRMLRGELWVLASDWCGSAAGYAARLSKSSGFASLVGGPTAYGGFGAQPLAVTLPNSRMIVRYPADYSVTEEGVWEREARTAPDFPSPDGESPLDTCLLEIQSKRGGSAP